MIGKNGIITENNFLEFLSKCKYDQTIHVEPDGSKWVHIFHHNNPASYLFTSTNDFENGCYIDQNRWFNIDVCKDLLKWEMMWIQNTTSSSSKTKYRWIQSVSPYGTSYDAVKPSAVTRITTSGYTNGGGGGMYVMNSSTYMVVTNTSNGNWFGATGCWTAYQGGIPGYPSTVVTSGCIDVYVRIDNGATDTSIYSNTIAASNFIEI